ncbi:MAG: hypothetical protein CLLPBCKN_006637 [Chroococcidiopsis cubana SAG 39.79]|uniref:Mu transposase C-terminal domain-containing protein n=2 Tax=Chroococcidiopsis cubana TaxID=171392 RepID=UPI002AC75761|nr:Mu transposase C-terminal domain-containing protein [Chroococcidiopsis cubana]MDZ4877202.1 hypothetical protein [Chroococcidiopsis cubana SAG 39.79]
MSIPTWVRNCIPTISRSTLRVKERCRRTAKQLKALGGNYGNRKGKGKIDANPALQQAIETCLAAGGKHWGASQIYHILLLEFGYKPEDFSLGQLRAWIHKFRIGNPQKWAMYMDASRAKSTTPAFGSRSQSVVRPNQVWEMDSFWNDIVLKYKCPLTETVTAKRYSLIGCIDLLTRRALLLLSDTSKAEAICQLLATAMTKWGVPEEVRTDRGKEYLSRRVKRFLENLGVKTSRCLPKHPEQKAFIERFIHTFQHRDLPKLPGFVGHSVSDRQALRSHPDWNERAIEIFMSPEEFQTWAEAWIVAYEQRAHGRAGIGLEGKSPLEVLIDAIAQGWQKQQIRNPRELDFLMMAAPSKDGMRRVGRQGISLNGRLYVAGELGDWIGRRVYVCFSPQAPIRIYVYTSADLQEYICEAVWREAEQINLAQFARQAQLVYKLLNQEVKQSRKRGQALLRKIAKDPMSILGQVQEILPVVQSQLHDYPALSAIAQAMATTEPQKTLPQISSEQYKAELAQLEAVEAERLARQQQAIALHRQLETLLEVWQAGGNCTENSTQILTDLTCYLDTAEGKGYLAALTDSIQEEQRFCSWLAGGRSDRPIAIEPNQLLQAVFQQWKQGLEVLLSEREFVAHYIQLPAGKGTLSALAEDRQEQQDFYQWLSQPEIVAT